MLSDTSYLTAIYIYVGSALAALVLLAWWLGRSRGAAWASLVVLLLAAALLTPAYPREGVSTLAPALVVAAFQLLTEGPEAAEHALQPLAFMTAAALALALVLRFTLFRRKRSSAGKPQGDAEQGA